jgi:hypothetical protein
MPHNQKPNADKRNDDLEMPEAILPGEHETQEWRPSDAAELPPLGQMSTGEVLDEAHDEWRPSDGADS